MTEVSRIAEIELLGIDGSNPLAFLAGLGTLRTLIMMHPEHSHKMKWSVQRGAWRPVVQTSLPETTEEQLCESMASYLAEPPQVGLLSESELGHNLTLSPDRFRTLALNTIEQASNESSRSLSATRCNADYLAAFGSDATYQLHSKDRTQMQDTALRTMSGAGHQHFIKFMREIISGTEAVHIQATLFHTWTYEDEGRGRNLRWDPVDDRRYAMRWKNPSSDPNKTMLGANRLAIEALPLFPVAARGSMLETTGFRTIKRRGTFWSWPIWDRPASLAAIGSMLNLPSLTTEKQSERSELLSRGVSAIYQSQRITVGKFRNFTPAKAIS